MLYHHSELSIRTPNQLKKSLASHHLLHVMAAHSPLSARLAEEAGFDGLWASGFELSALYGLADVSLISMTQHLDMVRAMAQQSSLPIVADIDTGFGNAVNVRHTIKTVERAGADAVQLEDQTFPKRCGHFAGKSVAPVEEMIAKIKAAADARVDPDFLIVARTDARAIHGFDHAVERVERFAEAGADVLFVEAAEGLDEVRRLPGAVSRPLLLNLVIGGKTPALDLAELERLRYGIVLYANAALQGAVAGMQRALGTLRRVGRLDEDPALVTPFAERQRLVDKPFFDDLEKQYAS